MVSPIIKVITTSGSLITIGFGVWRLFVPKLLDFPWYAYVIIGMGVFLCAGGVMGILTKALWLLHTKKTVGVIFGHETYAPRTQARPRYAPMLHYQTPSGETYTLTSKIGWGKPFYEIGTEMPVVYNPYNPGNAEIADFLNLWMLHVGLVLEGALLMATTVVYALTF